MLKQCPICGKNYKGRNKNACSMACYAVYKSNKKSCAVCGKQFFSPPSADTVTCSPECSAKNRQSPELISKNIQALAKAQAIRPFHPLTGKFETNANAKKWKIQSPDGSIYECRNLKNWLREHAELLDGTVAQAWDGITKIKYSLQGKRKFKSYQWKGWRLLEWGDG